MGIVRILVANAPRAYREVIAAAVQARAPELGVSTSEPDEIDGEVARLKPHLVVCSRLTEAVRAGAPAWVMLYPDGERRVEVSIGGDQTTLPDLEFDRLLSLAEAAACLAQMS